jgi:hypothetical protein
VGTTTNSTAVDVDWDGMGWDGMGWNGMEWNGMGETRLLICRGMPREAWRSNLASNSQPYSTTFGFR